MLELKNIRKTYKVGEIETKALDGICVAFRQKEFVAILGTSGSGKTTCLNIIGGLDRYDSGELTIKGKKTSDFSEKDWDAYRNNSIGFIFQNYNLIMHQSIVSNVELGMTLSGVSAAEKRRRALEVLEQVGLKDHLHKKPNQLSGGQMQRVAIARALANDPEILLCDEPTGALDTATSIQIMDLIKKLSADRLVIMVTHNPEIAEKYADRIVRFEDGKIIADSHPHQERPKPDGFKLINTGMSFLTAMKLSFNNLKTKKWRTFLTAFASSIGIIGIAVILSLSSGFQIQIDKFQSDALSEFPIIISQQATSMDAEQFAEMRTEMQHKMTGTEEYAQSDSVFLYDPAATTIIHQNIITDDYLNYINAVDPEICQSIGFVRTVSMNLLRESDDGIVPVQFLSAMSGGMSSGGMSSISSMNGVGLSSYPKILKEGAPSYLEKNYELLAGEYPTEATDLVLVIDTRNRIDVNTLGALGFETEGVESISFSDIVDTEMKIIPNDNYYTKTEAGTFFPSQDLESMYSADGNITVRIAGIVRKTEDASMALLGTGIAYSDELSQMVIDSAADSAIVKAQLDSNKNVITMADLDEASKELFVSYLGGSVTPYMVLMFPDTFDDKDTLLAYLDEYNSGLDTDDQIIYTDLAGSLSMLTGGIMDGITIVLIAFAAISLVVSLIMISIITYTSVLERTKEIGILRALGARRKDITHVFDAETCILGLFSGVLGVGIAYLLTLPINALLYSLTDLTNVAQLQPLHAVTLILVSTLLTMLGGHIPAKMASKKDAVVALRSE